MTGTVSSRPYLELTTDCTMAVSTISCVTPTSTSLSLRSLGPGTYYILLEPSAAGATDWSITVTFVDPPAPRNPGDACSSAIDITPVGASTMGMGSVSIATIEYDTGTTCGPTSGTRDAYFHFTLGAPQDVTIATSTGGAHSASLSTACGVRASELRCRTGATSPLSQTFHSLPLGEYWITVQTTAAAGTLTGTVTIAPPTTPPANDVCAGALTLAVPIDSHPRDTLIGFADDLRGGVCAINGLVDAFYTFTLASPMNVSIDTVTIPAGTSDMWLTLRTVCGAGADIVCATGHGSAHLGTTTALAAGTYYLYVEMRDTESSDFRLQFAAFP
jgi:hypothetical protein